MVTTKNAKMELDAGQNTIKNVKSTSKTTETVQGSPLMGKNSQNNANLNEISTERYDVKAPPLQQDGACDIKCEDNSLQNPYGKTTLETLNKQNSVQWNALNGLDTTNSRQKRLNNSSYDDQMEVDDMSEKINHQDNNVKQVEWKGLSFTMEFQVDEEDDHHVGTSMCYVTELLKKWIKGGSIQGIIAKDGSMIKDNLEDFQAWVIPPKIVQHKEHVKAELITMVKSQKTAHGLYRVEEKHCQSHNIRVTSKNTIMECATKIGFLTGTHVKIASTKYYVEEVKERLQVQENLIDVKKECTHDKGKRSKVLAVHATQESAAQFDKMLDVKSKRFRHMSCKRSTSDSRLAAMHFNEMANRRGRYETLFNASLKEKLIIENEGEVTFESYLMSLKDGDQKLFIATEQGAGKYQNDVTVIINPKANKSAKHWIVNDYPRLQFVESKERMSTVNEDKYEDTSKCNEELIVFLKPTLESRDAAKNKTFGKNMKSHAQALGTKKCNNPPSQVEKKDGNKSKKNKTSIGEDAKQIVASLQDQVKQLKELVLQLTKSMVGDENLRNNAVQTIENMEVLTMEREQVVEQASTTKRKEVLKPTSKEKNQEKRKNITPKYQFEKAESTGGFEVYDQWCKEERSLNETNKRAKHANNNNTINE